MLNFIKSFLANLTQNLLATVLVALITVPVLVGFFSGTLDALLGFITSPTPVWFTTGVIAGGLLYARYFAKKPKEYAEQCQAEDYFIEDSGYKWKVADFKNGHISIDPLPYCVTHEFEYVQTPDSQLLCRETFNSECSSKIMDIDELTFLSRMAKSKAQSLANKYETRH